MILCPFPHTSVCLCQGTRPRATAGKASTYQSRSPAPPFCRQNFGWYVTQTGLQLILLPQLLKTGITGLHHGTCQPLSEGAVCCGSSSHACPAKVLLAWVAEHRSAFTEEKCSLALNLLWREVSCEQGPDFKPFRALPQEDASTERANLKPCHPARSLAAAW